MTGGGSEQSGGGWMRLLRGRHGPQAIVLALGMAVQAGCVLYFARNTWFTADAWYYISRRGLVDQANLGLLEPYAGHWQTIPILVFRGMFATAGLDSYQPYLILALLLHFAICVLLYVLLSSLGISPMISAIAVWLVLFYGYGAEAFSSDGPIPLTLTLVWGLLAMLLTLQVPDTVRGPRGTALTVAVAVLLLLCVMTSLLGLVMMAWVVLSAGVVGRGWRWGSAVATPAGLSLLAWFLVMGRHSERIHLGEWMSFDIVRFVWRGLTTSLQSTVAVAPWGGVLLLALVVVLLRARALPLRARSVAWTGALAAVVQMSLIALGTSPASGVAQSEQSRYGYVALVLLAPAVALGLVVVARIFETHFASGSGDLRLGFAVVVVVLCAPTLVGVIREHQFIDVLTGRSNVLHAWIGGSIAAVADGQEILVPRPGPSDLQKLDLRLLTDPGIAVPLRHPAVTTADRLAAEIQFFTSVGVDDPGLPLPLEIGTEGLLKPDEREGPCGRYRSEDWQSPVVVVMPGGSALRVTSSSGVVTTQLSRAGQLSGIRTWRVGPGPVFVASSAVGAELRVSFDGRGDFQVCAA